MALPDIPEEMHITDLAILFKVRRATASAWVVEHNIQYRTKGNSKLIPKSEVKRLAQIRLAEGKA